MYKDYRLQWVNPAPDENGFRLVTTRIECMETMLPAVLRRMPEGEYVITYQNDKDIIRWQEDCDAYGEAFEEAGLGALASSTTEPIMVIDKGYHRWHQVDEHHNPHVADRATYTHNYLLGDRAVPDGYFDRVDTYSVKNRVLLIDESLVDL